MLDAIPAAPPAHTELWIRGILGGQREEAARLFPPPPRGLRVKPPGRVRGGGKRRKRKGPGGVQGQGWPQGGRRGSGGCGYHFLGTEMSSLGPTSLTRCLPSPPCVGNRPEGGRLKGEVCVREKFAVLWSGMGWEEKPRGGRETGNENEGANWSQEKPADSTSVWQRGICRALKAQVRC